MRAAYVGRYGPKIGRVFHQHSAKYGRKHLNTDLTDVNTDVRKTGASLKTAVGMDTAIPPTLLAS